MKTVREHLQELKKSLIHVAAFFATTTLILFLFSEHILLFVLDYYALQEIDIIVTAPASYLLARLVVALVGGVLLTIPYFVIKTKQYTQVSTYSFATTAGASLLLAALGFAFGFTIFAKYTLQYFLLLPEQILAMWTLDSVIRYVFFVSISFALIAQTIILTPLIVRAGIVTKQTLKKSRPYIFVGMLVIASLLTPPDPYTQLAMVLPMQACFEIGLLLAKEPKQKLKKNNHPIKKKSHP